MSIAKCQCECCLQREGMWPGFFKEVVADDATIHRAELALDQAKTQVKGEIQGLTPQEKTPEANAYEQKAREIVEVRYGIEGEGLVRDIAAALQAEREKAIDDAWRAAAREGEGYCPCRGRIRALKGKP